MKRKLFTIVFLTLLTQAFSQSCADLFISEYVEGWSNNKAIELYNPTASAIDLSAYRLVRYSNGNPGPPEQQWMVYLSGTIEPNRTFVIVLDKRDPNGTGQETPAWDDLQDRADVFLCPDYEVSHTMYFNGDDALTLEKNDGTILDIFGKYGERPLNEFGGTSNPVGGWSTEPPHNTGDGVIITRDHTMLRTYDVDEGITENPEHFDPMAEYDTLPANTFTSLNWHESVCMTGTNEKPEFSQSAYEFTLPPDSPAGTSVGFVSASDPDDDLLSYFIVAGNPYHPFMIDRTTGEIVVEDPEQILSYPIELAIDVTDGTSPVSATVTITSGLPLYDVTFNVDMTNATVFDPETDDVYIAGDFAGWAEPGTDTSLMMDPSPDDPMIYTLTVSAIEQNSIMYKYFRVINDNPSWNWGEWMGDPNREVEVSDNMVIDDIWALILPEGDEIVADFEVGGTSLDILAIIGSGAWNNNPISETIEIIDNPDPTGINTSSKVLQFLRRGTDEGGEPHAGFVVYDELNTLYYQYLHVMVWKPRITPLKVSCHEGNTYFDSFNMNEQHFTGAWVDIVFDLRANEYPTNRFDFMPDYEDPVTISELSTIYIDNFVLSNDPNPIRNPINNFEAGQTNVCENSPVQFSPDTAYVEYDSVMWTFPGGNPAEIAELFPEVTYSNSGIFNVTLHSWIDGQQFEVFKAAYIEVFAVPDQPEIPDGSQAVCFNAPYSTYLTTNASSIWELEPSGAGTISYSDSICAVFWNYAFTGEAELRVKIFNGCGEGEFSDPLIIQRMEPSGVDFSASQTLLVEKPYTIMFTNLTPDLENYTFLWDFGNGETSTLPEPEYTYPESGEYSVTLTAAHQTEGCVDSIYKEEYIFCSGVGIGETYANDFSYWVNQNQNCLVFDDTEELIPAKGTIYNMLGYPVKSFSLNQKTTHISLDGFRTGAYLIRIDGNHSGKFVITR